MEPRPSTSKDIFSETEIKSEYSDQTLLKEETENLEDSFDRDALEPDVSNPELKIEIVDNDLIKQETFNEETIEQTNKSYSCSLCPKSFTRHSSLVNHEKSHFKIKKIYKCNLCQKEYSRKQHFIAHSGIHTRENPLRQVILDNVEPRPSTSKHIFSETERKSEYSDEALLEMKTENLESSSEIDPRDALETDVSNPELKIEIVDNDLIKQETFHEETNEQTNKSYSCSVCPKSFTRHSSLVNHEKSHFKVNKLYKCKECPKEFSSESFLIAHSRVHAREKPLEQVILDKMEPGPSTSKDIFSETEIKSGYSDEALLEVKTENLESSSEIDPKDAMEIDDAELKIEIVEHDLVKQETFDEETLDSSDNIEQTNKSYSCSVCTKTFTRHGSLVNHEKSHFKVNKLYKCKVCPKQFSSESYLKAHLRIHSRGKRKL